jgi:hypothetical protein
MIHLRHYEDYKGRFGGGAWTRTTDLRIMSRPAVADSKQLQQDSSADSGKLLQDPQPPRNKQERKEKNESTPHEA